ncbi:rna-directed dna polymerase from mobile element jockey-like [Limosa lapponica baueri]|uniref:Rna-directed dna polymerase from mobile element jockey-like n=1 Tax=Limosa lapponica baueri TaxID=1758121 RepID=A0A2I0UT87_LIMLA|nr:rna-directed dna polymerase from mobile element jockey-like [Limosa lapponica baueri]
MMSFYDEMTGLVDEGRAVNIVCLDFECTLNEFTDDTKLGGVADTPQGCVAIQQDLYRLDKWADRNLLKFNKGKYEVLHLERKNLRHKYMLGANELESRKGPGDPGGYHVDHEPTMCRCGTG